MPGQARVGDQFGRVAGAPRRDLGGDGMAGNLAAGVDDFLHAVAAAGPQVALDPLPWLEPFQRRVIEELVRLLVTGRRADAKAVVDRWLADFAAHRVDVRTFARTETLQEPLEVYRERVASGVRPPSAAYELAAASGRPVQPGDQVSFYVTGRTARVPANEVAKLASAWDRERPDENVEFYQAKVLEIWQRFRRFAEVDGLIPYAEDEAESPQLSLF